VSRRSDLDLHVYPLDQPAQRAGFKEGAVYLAPRRVHRVCQERFEVEALERYLENRVG
jgi:hypothetical protein